MPSKTQLKTWLTEDIAKTKEMKKQYPDYSKMYDERIKIQEKRIAEIDKKKTGGENMADAKKPQGEPVVHRRRTAKERASFGEGVKHGIAIASKSKQAKGAAKK